MVAILNPPSWIWPFELQIRNQRPKNLVIPSSTRKYEVEVNLEMKGLKYKSRYSNGRVEIITSGACWCCMGKMGLDSVSIFSRVTRHTYVAGLLYAIASNLIHFVNGLSNTPYSVACSHCNHLSRVVSFDCFLYFVYFAFCHLDLPFCICQI